MDDKIKVVVGDDDKTIGYFFFDTLNEAIDFCDDCIFGTCITRNDDSEFYDRYLCCWKAMSECEAEYSDKTMIIERLNEIIDTLYDVLNNETVYIDVIDSIDSDNECTTTQRKFEFSSFNLGKISDAIRSKVKRTAKELCNYDDHIPQEVIKEQAFRIMDQIVSEFDDEIQDRIAIWDELNI